MMKREKGGTFGPQVMTRLRHLANTAVVCTSSGLLNKRKMRMFFKEVIVPIATERTCLIFDAWPTQKDPTIYDYPGKLFRREVLPEGSTAYTQPLDVGCFRYWKDLIRRITERIFLDKLDISLHERNFVIRMNSTVFDQFQAPAYTELWKAAWQNAGFDVPV
ncbi:hypothetical protein PGB90_000946 [Kerria lacca]